MVAVPETACLAALDALARDARRQAGGENFPVALRVLPARPQARLLALYDFARFVDDVGDAAYDVDGRAATPADRLALLDLVDADLDAPAPRLAPVAALAPLRFWGREAAVAHEKLEVTG